MAMIPPPMIATTLLNTVSTGVMIAMATRRGMTRNRAGVIDITSRASISSETFMVPRVAAMELPTLAARIRPVMKGPNSRTTETATSWPTIACCPYLASSTPADRLSRNPMNTATTSVTGRLSIPATNACRKISRHPRRMLRAEQKAVVARQPRTSP